ncbi:MAG TPA: hemerythrin family protein [Rhodospirillaceae bacterium]|nr:hemerythrin family protein [Rhodospirillaceae bacterium]
MSVGIEEIDSDHQHLISIINEFITTAKENSGVVDQATLKNILDKLKKYTAEHFAREEEMQKKVQYLGLEDNQRQHAILTKTLYEFIDNFFGGRLGNQAEATDKINAFLRRWLVDHIVKTDMKMRGNMSAP